jgi:large subunit ribosomal protein L29
MAILKMAEIREMNSEEIERKLVELRSELAKQRASMASGAGMENPGVIRAIRKSIARILTHINEQRILTMEEAVEEEVVEDFEDAE